MEDCYIVIYIDDKAYYIYYETDLLSPREYIYC